jgi:putative nucleotidyltransferase with HDIG domain
MAFLVYPGAVHTRFEHSLGVMHLAGKLAERLDLDGENRRLVRLAALLHDIGHGPFSHVSETIVDRFYDRKKISLPENKEKIHEMITYGLIERDLNLSKILSERDREKIVSLLKGRWGDRLLKDIVSGPLDADKQDYLLRDSYFCGVKYGVYDSDRLIDTLEVLKDKDEHILAVSVDGVHTLEQFVLAKYYMTTQVYRHKIRLITDAMIIRAIELGIGKDKLDYLCRLYSFDGTEEFFNNWLVWNDEVLTSTICSGLTPEGYCKEIFRCLAERKLYKQIFSIRIGDLKNPVIRQHISEEFDSFKDEIEEEIGDYLKIEPLYVISNKFTIQSVREQSRNSVGSILVLRESGPVTFEDESLLFRSIDEAEKDEFLEVYAPVAFEDSKDKKIRLRDYNEKIQEIIENVVSKRCKEEKNETIRDIPVNA